MRHLLVLALCGPLMMAADLKIDHATVAGSDLRKMQDAMQAVGLTTVYGGAHSNRTTEMALISFPDGSYLELMAIQPRADPALVDKHEWGKFLKGDAGPCAWAVQADDLAAAAQPLKTAGIPVSAPVKSGRARPDGVRLQWQTADVGPGIRGTFFPFLIQDFTPRVARAFPRGEPSNHDFRGIAKIVIVVASVDDAIQRYRLAYHAAPQHLDVDKEFGARLVALQGVPVVLAQPLAADSWIGKRLAAFGEGPCAFLLSAAPGTKLHTVSQAHWFGSEVDWYDPAVLGWHLGVERSQ